VRPRGSGPVLDRNQHPQSHSDASSGREEVHSARAGGRRLGTRAEHCPAHVHGGHPPARTLGDDGRLLPDPGGLAGSRAHRPGPSDAGNPRDRQHRRAGSDGSLHGFGWRRQRAIDRRAAGRGEGVDRVAQRSHAQDHDNQEDEDDTLESFNSPPAPISFA